MLQKNVTPKWGKPKLIIFVSAEPEEMVLQACKNGGYDMGPGYSECVDPPWNWCNALAS